MKPKIILLGLMFLMLVQIASATYFSELWYNMTMYEEGSADPFDANKWAENKAGCLVEVAGPPAWYNITHQAADKSACATSLNKINITTLSMTPQNVTAINLQTVKQGANKGFFIISNSTPAYADNPNQFAGQNAIQFDLHHNSMQIVFYENGTESGGGDC